MYNNNLVFPKENNTVLNIRNKTNEIQKIDEHFQNQKTLQKLKKNQ